MFDDVKLESEWQGDLKWQRINKNIKPLVNKNVLDVGSGNGYFTLRMAMEAHLHWELILQDKDGEYYFGQGLKYDELNRSLNRLFK